MIAELRRQSRHDRRSQPRRRGGAQHAPGGPDGTAAGSAGDYWRQSRRPLTGLLFVLPLLALYEAGVLLLERSAVRNGADVWLRGLLDLAGIGGYFLLPVLTVAALLAWHHTTRESWQVRAGVLPGMWLESALLGLGLVAVAHLQGALLNQIGLPRAAVPVSIGNTAGRMVGFLGAGIYEELLFRLLLLPALAGLIGLSGAGPTPRRLGAVILSSACFAAAHYVGPHGEMFAWYTFAFRFMAGGFFAVLFVYRGFGIAAGTHALYDIFVGIP